VTDGGVEYNIRPTINNFDIIGKLMLNLKV